MKNLKNKYVNFRRSVFKNPACLWRSRNIPYDDAIITGWGSLDFRKQKFDKFVNCHNMN